MSILYLCVCRDGNIVNEFPTGQKTMKETIKYKILPKLAPQDYKDKTEQERIRYNWEQTRRGVTFICVTTEDFNLMATFGCLTDMKKEYLQKEREGNLNAMSTILSGMKKKWMEPSKSYNPLLHLEHETFKVKGQMIENVEKIMQNLDKIEEIKDKSASLAENSRTFKKKTSDFASAMMRNNIILWGVLICTILVVIFVGIWLGCKWDFSRCKPPSGSGSGTGS